MVLKLSARNSPCVRNFSMPVIASLRLLCIEIGRTHGHAMSHPARVVIRAECSERKKERERQSWFLTIKILIRQKTSLPLICQNFESFESSKKGLCWVFSSQSSFDPSGWRWLKFGAKFKFSRKNLLLICVGGDQFILRSWLARF